LKEGIGGETRPKERVKTDKVTIDNSKVCMYNNNNNNNKNFKEKLSQFLLLSSSTWSSSYCILPKKKHTKNLKFDPDLHAKSDDDRENNLPWMM